MCFFNYMKIKDPNIHSLFHLILYFLILFFKGIRLKSQGITPRVAELCRLFETQLSTLLCDLLTLYPLCDNSLLDDKDDGKSLQTHQCTQCHEVLSQYVFYFNFNSFSALLLIKFI